MGFAIHAIWCKRRFDYEATCACGFTIGGKMPGDKSPGRKFIARTRAVELWGEDGIATRLAVNALAPAADRDGYWVVLAVVRRD